MMMEYTLIFLLGTVVGAVGMRFGNQSLRQRKKEQLALKKQRSTLEHYRHELSNHFARNVVLLDRLAADYRLLHRQLADRTLPGNLQCYNGFTEPVIEAVEKEQAGDDAMLIRSTQPCDYANVPSGLLRSQQQDQNS